MTCTTSCVQPSPSQCHCGACHITWSGITGFDQHRRDGECLTPEAIGYTRDPRGVYRAPITDERRQQLAALRRNAPSAVLSEPQTAEQPAAQGADGSGPETGTAGVQARRRSLFSQPHSWTPNCGEACNHELADEQTREGA